MENIKKSLLKALLIFVITFIPNSNLIIETHDDYESDDEKQLFI